MARVVYGDRDTEDLTLQQLQCLLGMDNGLGAIKTSFAGLEQVALDMRCERKEDSMHCQAEEINFEVAQPLGCFVDINKERGQSLKTQNEPEQCVSFVFRQPVNNHEELVEIRNAYVFDGGQDNVKSCDENST